MTNTEIKNIIKSYPGKITDLNTIIKNYIINLDLEYPEKWSLFQQAYHAIYLDSYYTILCPVCKEKPLKFLGLRYGYSKNCSGTCRNNNPDYKSKTIETSKLRYGTDFASQSQDFRSSVELTCITKFGVSHPMKSDKIKIKLENSIMKKYGVKNVSKDHSVISKIRMSRELTGDWISRNKIADLENYRRDVKSITTTNYHTHFYKINPHNLQRARYKYSLDHIYSVDAGFKNNVPAKIIGHWTNLRMLWHIDNSKKNVKCDKTLKELYEDYNSV